MANERIPQDQCPQCGDDLPETTPGDDGAWYVRDGDPLGCGCAGAWSCDAETEPWANHDDEECVRCRDEEIAYLQRKYDEARTALERATRERDESFDLNQRALQAFVPGLVSRDNMWGLEAREWRDDFKALLEKMSK
jgi:hypothetical protein